MESNADWSRRASPAVKLEKGSERRAAKLRRGPESAELISTGADEWQGLK